MFHQSQGIWPVNHGKVDHFEMSKKKGLHWEVVRDSSQRLKAKIHNRRMQPIWKRNIIIRRFSCETRNDTCMLCFFCDNVQIDKMLRPEGKKPLSFWISTCLMKAYGPLLDKSRVERGSIWHPWKRWVVDKKLNNGEYSDPCLGTCCT